MVIILELQLAIGALEATKKAMEDDGYHCSTEKNVIETMQRAVDKFRLVNELIEAIENWEGCKFNRIIEIKNKLKALDTE